MASDDLDEAPKRLSSDESLWGDQESNRRRGGPAFGVQVDEVPDKRPDPDPPEPRPRRRLLRVDVLIALAAVGLLLVGFLLGVAVTRAGTEEPPVADTATPPAAPPSTTVVVRQEPPPRECLIAMERADAAIAYLVGNIRDQRLSDTIQEFVESRRACQAAVR
jgi:hypothetical protein